MFTPMYLEVKSLIKTLWSQRLNIHERVNVFIVADLATKVAAVVLAKVWLQGGQDVREMGRVERLVDHDFILEPLGPSAR